MQDTQLVRDYFPGMGDAVADRTINRKIFTTQQRTNLPETLKLNPNDPLFVIWKNAADLSEYPVKVSKMAKFMTDEPELRVEAWGDVAARVAAGNCSLHVDGRWDAPTLERHLKQGTILMSGRHLQHGDKNQSKRPMEVFTNCSTAASTFLLFYLLLNGSGVGRAYDNKMITLDWTKQPNLVTTIDGDYPDREIYEDHWDNDAQSMIKRPKVPHVIDPSVAMHLHPKDEKTVWFKVPDSRGGWAKAFEILERMTFEGKSDWTLVLDFSGVRKYGSPIRGMQNRPSSGPGPLMWAFHAISAVRGRNVAPWMAAMMVDHHCAECVVVGGARRAARMATKNWRDHDVFDFIWIKWNMDLWSSNNSVTIDEEFRTRAAKVVEMVRELGVDFNQVKDMLNTAMALYADGRIDAEDLHAFKVLVSLAESAYQGPNGEPGKGEPGIINQDRLNVNEEGIEEYLDGLYAGSRDFKPDVESRDMMRANAQAMLECEYSMITNPCGEITLLMLGGYCVIADNVPFHAKNDDDAEEAFRMSTRALMRTNLMDSLYNREVKRTNRIGVGITGFHEWAYDRFGFAWSDIVDEDKSKALWLTLSRFKRAIVAEATSYAAELGVTVPHTDTTFKPAGTTSKLFGLTEGAHLPSMRWLVRWVQFRSDDPLVQEYAAKGYPTRELKSYSGTTIVGFPTAPKICELGGGEWVTTAAEATPEEQYQFLRLLEKYWIVGVDEDGVTPLKDTGNQVSYTLKYDPKTVSFGDFIKTLIDGQFDIRCCSVMPQDDATGYEYQPEEPVSKEQYEELVAQIENFMSEDIGMEHVDCGGGACPIDFGEKAA